MKKLLAKISSLVLIGASLIAGISCKLDVKLTEPATYIKISVNDNSRTIKPDVKLSDCSDFKLYQNEENEDNLLGSWTTFSTLSNAKIKIDEIHTFDSFILSAKCGESLYKDIQIAELQEGENNLSFYLKPVVTDNKGTGNIEITLKVPEALTITKDAETIFQLSGNDFIQTLQYSGNLSQVEVKDGSTELTYICEDLLATMYKVVIQTKVDDESYILYCGYGNVSAGLTSRETTNCLLMNQKALYTISFVTGDDNVTINPVTVQKGEVRVTSQGNGNGSQKYLIVTNNSEIDITPDCEDKTLAGWYWDEEFTESAMSGYWKLLDRDLTLYAKWITPVTLSFVSNVEDVTMEPVSIDSDLECQFYNSYLWNYRYGRYDYPEAEGYIVAGVYYDSEFTNKVPNGEWITFTEDTTLYLKYSTPPILSFIANVEDATIPSITGFNQITFDPPEYYLPSVGWMSYPEVEGYKFCGVYYDAEFNNKVPDWNSIEITEDTTLYLKYVSADTKYTVSFVTNMADITIDSVETFVASRLIFYSDGQGFVIDNQNYHQYPQVDGYVVSGVYTDSNYENKINNIYNVTEDATLYIKYTSTENTYLTFTISGDDAEFFKCYYNGEVQDFPATFSPTQNRFSVSAFIDSNENGVFDYEKDIRVGCWYEAEWGQTTTYEFQIVKTTANFTIPEDFADYESDKLYVINNIMQSGSSSKVIVPVDESRTGSITFYGNKLGQNGYSTRIALFYDGTNYGNQISEDCSINNFECDSGLVNITFTPGSSKL